MCGIAGVVSWHPDRLVTDDTLRAMAARIAHRGPDGEGVWRNAPKADTAARVGLAFRRLAILDCDARAMQPMTTPDGRYALVFNGEIYNFRELRAELPPRDWRTTGDTEVLLTALATWGVAATLPKLNGMFAFALWDEQEQTLTLARDRMGQKPLYYTSPVDADVPPDGSLAFASELTALAPWLDWDRTLNEHALAHYLRFGYVNAPYTIYRGVTQVPPGTWTTLHLRPGGGYPVPGFSEGRFKPPADQRHPLPRIERTPQQTRAVVETAVRRQLVSDVPLGVFLSGGIDSSVISLCARTAGPVRTFSIGFADPRYDETPYAEAVAKHLGTEHTTLRVTPDVADDLPKLAAVFGEPFGDSSALPTHWLCRQTRTSVTVALSGDGGDELFGGYDRYRAIGWRVGWLRPLAPVGRRLERGHPKTRLTRAGRLLAAAGLSGPARYDRFVSLFDRRTTAALLNMPLAHVPSGGPSYGQRRSTGGWTEAALAYDRWTYLPGDLLTKVDRCSMLHALEVRSPFMDPDVLDYANGLRRDQLLAGGPKRLLREAFAADLPAFVFRRKKTGFAVPVGDWFRASLRPLLHDTLSATGGFVRTHLAWPVVQRLLADHDAGRADHGQRLYALLMLELWWRTRAG